MSEEEKIFVKHKGKVIAKLEAFVDTESRSKNKTVLSMVVLTRPRLRPSFWHLMFTQEEALALGKALVKWGEGE